MSLRSTLFFLLACLIFACTNHESVLFDDLAERDSVFLYLKKYNLEEVPKEIGKLKKAKFLMISQDSSGWTIYPPFFEQAPPFKELPKEITTLTELRELSLVGLHLRRLPEDFGNLQNLEILNLAMNKLTISDEVEKLKKLKNLKYLSVIGHSIREADVHELKRSLPNVEIEGLP